MQLLIARDCDYTIADCTNFFPITEHNAFNYFRQIHQINEIREIFSWL